VTGGWPPPLTSAFGVKNLANPAHTKFMNKATRIIGSLVLLAVSVFCVFGFIATFEPLDASTQLAWRAIYGLVGLACLGGIVILSLPRKHKP
jgi:hypothetical protein